MINKVILVGRLTKDPELRKTQSNKSALNFTLACNRRFKDEEGKQVADFPNCVAWNQSAEYLAGYAHQGDLIGVEGSIQTRSYDGKDGKVYVTEVLCNNVCILGHKQEETKQFKVPAENWGNEPSFKINGESEKIETGLEDYPWNI